MVLRHAESFRTWRITVLRKCDDTRGMVRHVAVSRRSGGFLSLGHQQNRSYDGHSPSQEPCQYCPTAGAPKR
ncbi:hypothetical protein BN2537_1207 [Streptomyces venezuelae]|nr:hypothetical protein BN2537_1207 [Streptomyces venezuelae]